MNETNQIPLYWRIGAIVLVAVVVLGLLYFFISSSNINESPTGITSGTPSGLGGSADDLFQKGNIHFEAGEWQEAINAYEKAVEANPNYQEALANLGASYYRAGQLKKASETYQQAILLSPNDADVIYNLGAIYLQEALADGTPDQEKLDQAVKQINRAIELNPNLAQPYYGRGMAYQFLGEIDKAIADFEKFIELDDETDRTATEQAQAMLQQLKFGK